MKTFIHDLTKKVLLGASALFISTGVFAQCAANFAFVDLGGGTFQFTNLSTGNDNNWWSFGDANSSTQTSPTHTYAANGTYIVCLTVSDSLGTCFDTLCQPVVVTSAGACTAGFSSFDSLCNMFFINTSTGAASYEWYFGDGSPVNTQQDPMHTYAMNGTYFVTLICYDGAGNFCDSTGMFVTVTNCAPQSCSVQFTMSQTGSCTIAFFSATTGTSSILWDFGDGNQSTQANPTHSWAVDGVYTVCLYGYDSQGNICDTICMAVSVSGCAGPSCNASFWAFDSLCTMYFVNQSTGAAGYEWYFGDGSPVSTQMTPQHTYGQNGTYYVTLICYDGNGNFCDSTGQWVTLTNCGPAGNCSASFSYTDLGGGVIQFNNTSTGSGTAYWTYGDGSPIDNTWSPIHTYSTSGWYWVCLTLADSIGLCDSLCQQIYVTGTSACNASFTASDLGNGAWSFNNTSTGSSSAEWWVDGNVVSTNWNYTHTFTVPGNHWVCVYLYDSLQQWCDSTCMNINVTLGPAPCNASFTWQISGLSVTLTNTSTGSYSSTNWEMGDATGWNLNTSNPFVYTFATAGCYWVTLGIDDSTGVPYGCDSIGALICVPDSTGGSVSIPGLSELSVELNAYPNPFNDHSAVEYSIGTNVHVEIRVVNMLGELVTMLENGTKSAGTHRVIWDAYDQAEGIYLLQLITGDQIHTKKLVLSK